jgi:hypothetical protein
LAAAFINLPPFPPMLTATFILAGLVLLVAVDDSMSHET